mgnify:CR=1 FL=1
MPHPYPQRILFLGGVLVVFTNLSFAFLAHAGASVPLLVLVPALLALDMGGRCAVIVPDGVLFGSSRAHVALRKKLVEAYQTVNPDVAVAVSGGGSGTGIAAMINGTVDIAAASRQPTASGPPMNPWAPAQSQSSTAAMGSASATTTPGSGLTGGSE